MPPYTENALRIIGNTIRDRWIWAISWFAPFALVWFSLAYSPAFQACVSKPPREENQPRHPEKTTTILEAIGDVSALRWECTGVFIENNHEEIVAVFTMILAIVTGTLWRSTERLVKGADANAERQMRAYITIHSAEATPIYNNVTSGGGRILTAGYRPGCEITMINNGQTPAYDLRIRGNTAFVEWPIDETELETISIEKNSSRAILGPGGRKSLSNATDDTLPILTDDDVAALIDGTHAFIAYGVITYRTIFGKDCFLHYRFFIGGPVGLGDSTMSPHSGGNDADYRN
jgi:hypothetical protein